MSYPKYYWNKDKKLIAEFDWDGDINLYGLQDDYCYYLANHNFIHDKYKLVTMLEHDGIKTTIRDWEETDKPWEKLKIN